MKDFLLLSTINAITYKDFFPLIKEDKVRPGYTFNGTLEFDVPEDYDGSGTLKVKGITWFVTLPATGRRKLVLTKTYDPKLYPKYDNYDAINVDRVKDIPYDYDGVMGVPITIFGYDLDNVEVMGMAAGSSAVNGFGSQAGYTKHKKDSGGCPVLDGESLYARILIKRRK